MGYIIIVLYYIVCHHGDNIYTPSIEMIIKRRFNPTPTQSQSVSHNQVILQVMILMMMYDPIQYTNYKTINQSIMYNPPADHLTSDPSE